MSNQIDLEDAEKPFVKRNYYLLRHYLLYLVDSGLNYLKREYIRHNSENSFAEFTANNYYDYILKDYIRRKVKSQIKAILNAAVEALPYFHEGKIAPDHLDEIVKKRYPFYAENDMSLLHTALSHPGRAELQTISKLSFRVAIIQIARIINCEDPDVETYGQLIRSVYPNKEQSITSLQAVLTMVDQMIDCFERSLDLISIPFYKPTWNLRDFSYMRKIYEFALQETHHQIDRIYSGEMP